MNKEELSNILKDMGIHFNKMIFKQVSPYQKRRYKKEYVGWEAWLYNDKSSYGWLIKQEDFDNKEYFKEYMLSF